MVRTTRCRRHFALILALVHAAAYFLFAAGAQGAIDQGSADVPIKPIQPGGAVCPVEEFISELLNQNECTEAGTLNFVFKDDAGELYIGSAAHVFSGVGNKARVPGEADAFGKVVVDIDSVDVAHPGAPPDPDALDFALIRIDRERYSDVEPRVRHWGGPTGHTTASETDALRPVVAYGNGGASETREGDAGPRGENGDAVLVADSSQAFSSTVAEIGGDSGMPYLYAPTGKALGVNGNCPCGGPGYYPTVEHLLERLAALGWRLTLVTGAPGPPLESLLSP